MDAIKSDKAHVLVVDDCQDTLVMLRFMFESCGADVYTATSGTEALSLLSDKSVGLDSFEFNLLLVDIRMPEMRGNELAQRARGLGYKGKIVALTAAASGRGRQESLEAGIDSYFGKDTMKKSIAMALVEEVTPTR